MFICILVVFIVIVIFVIFLNKNDIYNNFYNLFTNFEGYRLGDIYNGNGGDDAENYIIKNKNKFKNTIGYKYIINRKKKT